MGFASTYIENRALFPEFIKEAPEKETGIIVVVPAYDEPGIRTLLDSLLLCLEPQCKVEVIIVINAPLVTSEESIKNNRIALKNIESWKRANKNCFFRLFAFNISNHSMRDWGVGLARKTGMDEAVRRFNSIDNPDGIILNLDADCRVEKNYFVSVLDEFSKGKERTACSIYFEHPLSGTDFSQDVYNYITLYELHLRYYFQGLAFCDFPYVFHTIGSAMAVKTMRYIKAGGMNRRQAGEDFYFIQKLVQAGGFFSINSTTIYPSPRLSTRVPFGTGASIARLSHDNMSILLTYNILAFNELRTFFSMADEMFSCKNGDLQKCYNLFPAGLRLFLAEEDWLNKIMEIKKNTSGLTSFQKRFFVWFNMFKIVKYLNFVHQGIFEKKPVDVSASDLLENLGINFLSKGPVGLLLEYRMLELKV